MQERTMREERITEGKTAEKGISLVILAAGNSQRFHGNKLLYPFQGRPMYEYLAEQISLLPADTFSETIVVTQYEEIRRNMEARGFRVVENREPELGISHSIHLGVRCLQQMWAEQESGRTEESREGRAVCFAVSDQPYLKHTTISHLIEKWKNSGKGIGCLSHQGELGNPAVFSGKYLEELLALTGDVGGKRVIRRHLDDLYLLEVEDGMELVDIDVRTFS